MDLKWAENGAVYIVMWLEGHGKMESMKDGGDLD